MRLETELQALRAFSPAVKAELPFLIPHIAGSVRQGELSTFVYSHLTGTARSLDALTMGGRTMAEETGRVLAAIHDLPKDMVQRADLPSYEANEYRQRKLNELDQAATTGRIPAILLRRWEHALEDVALWRFTPTVVHGDLHEDHLLIGAGRISAVTGWTDLSIGDPAADFAWLAAAEDSSFVDTVYTTYAEARGTAADPHIARRAALAAEFALAQWLVRGVALDDERMISEADGMLATLRADVETIEHEQQVAAERARLAHEEQLEWGDDAGTDVVGDDGVRPDGAGDDVGFRFGSPPPVAPSGPFGDPPSDAPRSGSHLFDPARTDMRGARPEDGLHDAGPSPARSEYARPEAASVSTRSEAARPVSTRSEATRSEAARSEAEQAESASGSAGSPGIPRQTDGNASRSGSSAAYARLTAARGSSSTADSDRATTTRSANITLLRNSGTNTAQASADDVQTSTIPVISYGS